VVIDGDDYLDARQPAWIAIETAGAVKAVDRKIHLNPASPEVLVAVAQMFPRKYTPHGERR
jgi:hypothetical protein